MSPDSTSSQDTDRAMNAPHLSEQDINRGLSMDLLDFDLPKELIATRPVEPRDSSKLLVVQRSNPDRIEHRRFSDLPNLLELNDLLVFNESSVVPARLIGVNPETGGKFEGLYLREFAQSSNPDQPIWIAMIKAKRTKPGKLYQLIDPNDQRSEYVITLLEKHPEDGPGAWKISVTRMDSFNDGSGDISGTHAILSRVGHTPLPPYIVSQRRERGQTPGDEFDRSHYQTIYADQGNPGSVAAPTAGLHFTDSVLNDLTDRGIEQTKVTLHVGAGTFKPVETELLNDHPMHAETCSLGGAREHFFSESDQGSQCDSDRRVFAIGSTSARTLESYAQRSAQGLDLPDQMSTQIMIAPGYRWGWVDGMITNFHLPRSTLLAMVASLLDDPGKTDGIERIQRIYSIAIQEKYRFFSYGDAMLILP